MYNNHKRNRFQDTRNLHIERRVPSCRMIKWLLNEFGEVESTQTILRNLGSLGVNEGTVVVAKRQTAGRGRHGRAWVSPEGGLYMSILLRPPTPAALQTLTLTASLAVVRGIENATGLNAKIRWPNDVMIKDKKVAGVIAESSFTGEGLTFVMVGIGVNCNSTVSSVEPSSPATSLAGELGRDTDIKQLRQAILDSFGTVYDEWLRGTDAVKLARGVIGTIGKRAVVTMKSGENLEGVVQDIDQAGGLLLERNGQKLTIHSEDVERLREA
jgi:BirA family transcriptional regulator, biotin operon repressor / biotin---[acetyl-CoA-carboxylase] ligase